MKNEDFLEQLKKDLKGVDLSKSGMKKMLENSMDYVKDQYIQPQLKELKKQYVDPKIQELTKEYIDPILDKIGSHMKDTVKGSKKKDSKSKIDVKQMLKDSINHAKKKYMEPKLKELKKQYVDPKMQQITKQYVDPTLDKIGPHIQKALGVSDQDYDLKEHLSKMWNHEDVQKKKDELVKHMKDQATKKFFEVTSKNKDKISKGAYKTVEKIGKLTGHDFKKPAKMISKIAGEMAENKYTTLQKQADKISGMLEKDPIDMIQSFMSKDGSTKGKVRKTPKKAPKVKRPKVSSRATKKVSKMSKGMKKTSGKFMTTLVKKFPKLAKVGKIFTKSMVPGLGDAANMETMLTSDSSFLKTLAGVDLVADKLGFIPGAGTAISSIGSALNFGGSVLYETAPDWLKQNLDSKTDGLFGKEGLVSKGKNMVSDFLGVDLFEPKKKGRGKSNKRAKKNRSKNNRSKIKPSIKGSAQIKDTNVYNLYHNNHMQTPKEQSTSPRTQNKDKKANPSNTYHNQFNIYINAVHKSTTEILNELIPRLKKSMANQYAHA